MSSVPAEALADTPYSISIPPSLSYSDHMYCELRARLPFWISEIARAQGGSLCLFSSPKGWE
jgi:hypothetical protein